LILISGSSGFVAGHLCKALSEKGHTVHGIDKVQSGRNICLDHFIEMDLCDLDKPGDHSWLEDYDYIFHLAAETGLSSSPNWRREIQHMYQVNTKATLNLVKYSNPKKFIFTSTAALYGEGNHFKETDSLRCNNGYGFSKAIAETAIEAFGVSHCIFRPGTIVGPYGRSVLNRFVYDCVHGKNSRVFNHGYNKRSFIDVDDVVSSLIAGMELDGVYNLASNEASKVGDILDVIANCGRKHGCLFDPEMVSDLPNGLAKTVYLDNRKLLKTGKWVPKVNVYSMVERLFDHYMNNEDAGTPPEWR